MNFTNRTHWIYLGLLLMTAFALGACASTPPQTPMLDQARTEYNEADGDPMVSRYAPVALYEARKSLDMAETAKDQEAREHYAFIARRQIEIAVTRAEQQRAEDQVQTLREKRQEILMQKREMEIDEAKQEAAAAKDKLAGLQEELAGLQAKKTGRGIVVTMGGVLFKVDEADLMPGAMRIIDQVAQFLENHPEYNASIEGHTDSTGPATYNQELSERRAQAVKSALEVRGIPSARLKAIGLGENYPVASNDTAAGRQQNRRVEIVLVPQES